MKYAQLVIGPAGSGKSTYCDAIRQHCEATRRQVFLVNLDPAAEEFKYPVSVDIRELISLEDVMDELQYGPNGGLVYCMEYLLDNLHWLKEQLDDFGDDDYIIFDCPGQIELFSHIPVMPRVVESLQKWGFNVCAVCLLDSQFVSDASKFISGVLMCLSAMVALQLPHINVLSKMDLLKKKERELERFVDPDVPSLIAELDTQISSRFHTLNTALATLIQDYNMVGFVPLNIKDEDSIADLLAQIDNAIQYGEDLEPREYRDPEEKDTGGFGDE